jgi:hypothetical protein
LSVIEFNGVSQRCAVMRERFNANQSASVTIADRWSVDADFISAYCRDMVIFVVHLLFSVREWAVGDFVQVSFRFSQFSGGVVPSH